MSFRREWRRIVISGILAIDNRSGMGGVFGTGGSLTNTREIKELLTESLSNRHRLGLEVVSFDYIRYTSYLLPFGNHVLRHCEKAVPEIIHIG